MKAYQIVLIVVAAIVAAYCITRAVRAHLRNLKTSDDEKLNRRAAFGNFKGAL
ncbi:MAG: hypothetical protein K2N33_01495 [Clostridia bacterium]|nr:hypothetical protein [Clostridia bacterium]